jgi:hypothetical protein
MTPDEYVTAIGIIFEAADRYARILEGCEQEERKEADRIWSALEALTYSTSRPATRKESA